MASSRSLTLSVLACALLAGLAACDRQSGQQAQPVAQSLPSGAPAETAGSLDRRHKGSRLPDLTFADPAGHALRLTSLSGKPLLLNLWATWCGPCVAELPTLRRLASERAGAITVVAVSQDLGDGAAVAKFWSTHGFAPLPLWLDPDNAATSQYQVGAMPTTIYYDARGRELWRFTGPRDWLSADSARLLAEGR